MSERYTRVFTLTENLYAEGSPVIIEAGALLKDSQTGSIIAQLKLKNITNKVIKAAKVSVKAFDITGVELQGVDNYQYLDLSARRDDSFGQKNAIVLPDNVARSFSCVCTSVIFSDGTIWDADGTAWGPLAGRMPLDRTLPGNLVSQYKRDVGEPAKYAVTEDKGLWYCTCGAINRGTEFSCHSCGKNKGKLVDALNTDVLNAHYEAYLAKEAEKAAAIERANAEARAKKLKKIKRTVISIVAVVLAVVLFFLSKDIIIPTVRYNTAVKNMDAGRYEKAIATFEKLDGYKDSKDKIPECKYAAATALMEAGDYDGAIAVFEALKGYEDSRTKVSECKYRKAVDLMELGYYAQAKEILKPLTGIHIKGKLAVIEAIDNIAVNKFHEAIKGALFASEAITVKYNLNGGTSASGDSFTYTSSAAFKSLLTPEREGYRFIEWKLSEYSYSEETSLVLVLDAVWSDAYVITYNLNGGTAENPAEYRLDSEAIALNNPTREGYTFAGWTGTDLAEATESVTIPTGSYGDRTYTANWTPVTYQITYDLAGGTNASGNPKSYTPDSGKITLNDPTRAGYTFAGWTGTDLIAATKGVIIPAGSLGDRSYTATWTVADYKITYNLNGGTAASGNPTGYSATSAAITLKEPTRTGYTFAGWSGTGLSSVTKSVTIPTGSYGNRTYTANWTPITYKITYNLNGGTNASGNPTSYTPASAKITLKNPTRDGYFFAGWYRDSSYATKVTEIAAGSTGDITLYAQWKEITIGSRSTIAAGLYHTVAVRTDGTVVSVGDNARGQRNVSSWRDIIAVAAYSRQTVGLKSDGTVVAVGDNEDGQCNVSGWRDIVAISAGRGHTVGLKSDGTVVAVGSNRVGQCNVSSWRNIVAISAGYGFTAGLKSDGTVVAVGNNDDGQCNVSGWRDIVAISAGAFHTVGLKSDGTVVAVGYNSDGQCNVSGWRDIVAISAGDSGTIGLKSDGTVVAVGSVVSMLNGWRPVSFNVSGWHDIVAIVAGEIFAIGLKSDGTMVAMYPGDSYSYTCDVSGFKNIAMPN